MTETLLQQSNDDHIEVDENKNYLEELVGEGKKFKTPEELAKGKWYSDAMIDIQNKRLDEMRADYLRLREENTAKAKLEDLIDQISKKQLTSNEAPPVKEETEKPAIDMDQIKSLMSNQIQEYEQVKRQSDNYKKVQSKLIARHGKNYSVVLNEQLQMLGLSDKQVTDLAKESPDAAMQLLGLNDQVSDNFQAPPRSQQRTDKFAPQGAQKRTWAYYQGLKKSNPDLYFDPKIANQMAKDAVELGDSFNDGNFYESGLHER